VNISGIEAEAIQRGDVVVHPGQYQPVRRLDARFQLLNDSSSTTKHGDEVKFFVGASETIAMLRLLGREELSPGEEGWIQLELRDPVVAVRGDRYILRRPSPGETLGGGVIVDHQPRGRHKRFDEQVLKSLESLSHGTPAEVLFEAALALQAVPIREIVSRSRLETSIAEPALMELLDSKSLISLEEGESDIQSERLVIALPHWNSLRDTILQTVESHHKSYPLRRGIPREELKSKLKLSPRVFNAVIDKLIRAGSLLDRSTSLAKPEHEIRFDNGQQAGVQSLMRRFEQNPFGPPSFKECLAEVGAEVMNALVEMGTLYPISNDIVLRKQDYDEAVGRVLEFLLQKEMITLAEVRDLLNTSRKYAQALLEHLDALGITTREGDFRKLKKK
jgi:selenocysteine-specific elongation factor